MKSDIKGDIRRQKALQKLREEAKVYLKSLPKMNKQEKALQKQKNKEIR